MRLVRNERRVKVGLQYGLAHFLTMSPRTYASRAGSDRRHAHGRFCKTSISKITLKKLAGARMKVVMAS
jgi:hypothetical protein